MYTPLATLQEEVGASTVEGRNRKIKLRFGLYVYDREWVVESNISEDVWGV